MSDSDLVSKIEEELPENTRENPQPTVFLVKNSDLGPHMTFVRSFPFNQKIKTPVIEPFVNKEQLNEAGDEYTYTAKDDKGETKITENGHLLGGRKFLATTFTLPGHGKKLYMLANDAARLTGYREAFIMFGKNKSLLKYSVNEEYRQFFLDNHFQIGKVKSRPIGLVTTKSLFMFFGARVIQSGRRVIDDYWEEPLLEQEFDEKEQVFPVDRKLPAPKPKAPKPRIKTQAAIYVTPLPPLEDRLEYIKTQGTGQVTQVLPGQGISGGLELSSLASVPKYSNDTSGIVKHKSLLSSLSTNNSTPVPTIIQHSVNQLVVSNELAGQRSTTGLPIYQKNITKRLRSEDAEKLKEIEYVHGAVETNFIMTTSRKPRNKTWLHYWQIKSGTPFGLIKEKEDEFKAQNEELLNVVEQEKTFNDYLNCDQIITKRRKPNANFLNHGNIHGLKPPYAEKPVHSNPLADPNLNRIPGLQSTDFGRI